ncbi:MAG: thioredoxin [Alkalispirochaetaceae bacterium]
MEIAVTEGSFEQEVLSSPVPVIVDFWADWCMPCKMIAPVLEELDKEYDGQVKIAKVDVDDQPELAQQYDVMSIPTLLVFKGGEIVKQHVGAAPKETLKALVQEYL